MDLHEGGSPYRKHNKLIYHNLFNAGRLFFVCVWHVGVGGGQKYKQHTVHSAALLYDMNFFPEKEGALPIKLDEILEKNPRTGRNNTPNSQIENNSANTKNGVKSLSSRK